MKQDYRMKHELFAVGGQTRWDCEDRQEIGRKFEFSQRFIAASPHNAGTS